MAFPAPHKALQNITAGWRYRNGGDHFAYDYAMPLKTPLYAVANGVILDCNDGVPNNPPGVRKRPSNWILLGIKHRGRNVTLYYQHLSPGLKVKKGQRVQAGQLIGYSGNSGWSTGPHLHLASGWGFWTEATRYAYMSNDGRNKIVLFPPSNIYRYPWGIGAQFYGYKAGIPAKWAWTKVRTHDGRANARDKWWVQQIQAQLGVPVDGYFGPKTKAAVQAWKIKRGYTSRLQLVDRDTAKRMGLPV